MHGNVWESCWDLYASEGSLRVRCGGSWDNVAADCRSAYRILDSPTRRDTRLGFRLALSSSGIPK